MGTGRPILGSHKPLAPAANLVFNMWLGRTQLKFVLTIATVLILSAGLSAQPKKTTHQLAAQLVGTWRITCESCSSPLLLELRVEGTRLVGKLNSRTVLGHVDKNGAVAFALPESWQAYRDQSIGSEGAKEMYATVSFATVRQDGTLEGETQVFVRGYGGTAIKGNSWTARRVVVR